MKYRNAKFLADGRINCEIEHPVYGWIPFTSSDRDDGAQFDAAALHAALKSDPETAPYVPPTKEEAEAAQAERVMVDRGYMSLSFAQMLIGLVTEGWISAKDGRAWRDRVALPAPVVALISGLPEAQQFAAETRALAPSEVLRSDPLVTALGAMIGKTPEEIDKFFRTYANIS